MFFKLCSILGSLALLSTPAFANVEMAQGNMATSTVSDGSVKGDAFLKQNQTNKDVVTLPNGLQYKILKAGRGPKPSLTDTVTVNYSGKLVDGTEFDSSAKHGGPAQFGVNQVIPGWTEALQLMPLGSTWEIYVPANLAYGDRGAPPVIGPNETLIFQVTLLKIN